MMTPRDEKNTAYTTFPEELLIAVQDHFTEEFLNEAESGDFFSFGRIYQNEIVLRVGYLKKGSISQVNFDTSTESSNSQAGIITSIEDLVFGTKELFVDYFKNKNLEHFSYHWNPLNSSSKVHYKFDATNTGLESQADALLGEELADMDPGEGLIVGEMTDSDEIEKIVDTLQTSHFTFK